MSYLRWLTGLCTNTTMCTEYPCILTVTIHTVNPFNFRQLINTHRAILITLIYIVLRRLVFASESLYFLKQTSNMLLDGGGGGWGGREE